METRPAPTARPCPCRWARGAGDRVLSRGRACFSSGRTAPCEPSTWALACPGLTFPVPVVLDGKGWDDLVAVAADGAVVLIGGLLSAPRVVGARGGPGPARRADPPSAAWTARASFTLSCLTDPTDRYPHGALGDKFRGDRPWPFIAVGSNALSVRGRYVVSGACRAGRPYSHGRADRRRAPAGRGRGQERAAPGLLDPRPWAGEMPAWNSWRKAPPSGRRIVGCT